MIDIMLDLETLSTSSNAVILSIGAIRFDKDGIGSEYYQIVNIQSCLDNNMTIDEDTVKWWMKQSNEAREIFDKDGLPINEVLEDLSNFITKEDRIWGCGAAFDNAILSQAYKTCGLEQPWEFWNNRCYRTIKSIFSEITLERQGVHHNALDDAKHQARHLIEICNQTGLELG